jgi:hypothetical protein
MPSEHQVRGEFQKEHPTATIVELFAGEQDDEHTLFTIRYQDERDGRQYRACWLYRDYPDSGWRVMSKASVAEPSPLGFCT